MGVEVLQKRDALVNTLDVRGSQASYPEDKAAILARVESTVNGQVVKGQPAVDYLTAWFSPMFYLTFIPTFG